MQDQILDMLLKEDEITWQTILFDLIKTEKMSPWDIDISLLTHRYIEIVKKLQEINFSLSGKVILAASLLLKIKSDKLLTENILAFDNLMYEHEELEDPGDFIQEEQGRLVNPKLTIKTPQTRKRKVSVNDLVFALERALEVEKRRKQRYIREAEVPDHIKVPEKKIDLGDKIKDIYEKIRSFLKKENKVTFTQLLPSQEKEDIIYTFIPLLHLDNEKKIHLYQEKPFEEIDITIKK
ncbi:segregation/condensation protein A [archaeon]|jgi:segregation and condensation protein A|nr:segregation/condensation protein A [archaeon]